MSLVINRQTYLKFKYVAHLLWDLPYCGAVFHPEILSLCVIILVHWIIYLFTASYAVFKDLLEQLMIILFIK